MEAKMFSETKLYDVLGVELWATASELKTEYRMLALNHHPDKNPDDVEANERFKKISRAYDVLGNEEKRKVYDLYGMSGVQCMESGADLDVSQYNETLVKSMRDFHSDVENLVPDDYVFEDATLRVVGWTGALAAFVESEPIIVPTQLSISHNTGWVSQLAVYKLIYNAIVNDEIDAFNSICAPTGSGKTIGAIAATLMAGRGKKTRILLFSPSKIVAHHVEGSLRKIFGHNNNYFIGIATRDDWRFDKHKTCVMIITHGFGAIMMRNFGIRKFTHFFVDEVHIRSLETDFIIELFKMEIETEVLSSKVFFMSASSIEVQQVANHLGGAVKQFAIPEGRRRYPVHVTHWSDVSELTNGLKDRMTQKLLDGCIQQSKEDPKNEFFDQRDVENRIFKLVCWIANGAIVGDIIVFVPGLAMMTGLRKSLTSEIGDKAAIIQLHGQLEQDTRLAIQMNKRKVVLSTNVAESGMTIVGVKFVIDSLLKVERAPYTHGGFVTRREGLIGAQSVQQRMGRCGRTGVGYYITVACAAELENVKENEGLTAALTDSPLQHMLMLGRSGYAINEIFCYVDQIDEKVYCDALISLVEGGFLLINRDDIDAEFVMTAIGEIAAEFVLLEPELALLIAAGTVFGCQKSMVNLASCLMLDKPIIIHQRKQSEWSFYNSGAHNGNVSEHDSVLCAYNYAMKTENEIGAMKKYSAEWTRLKQEFSSKINEKCFEHTAENIDKIKMAINRLGLLRTCLDSETLTEEDNTALLVCTTIAFGAHFGVMCRENNDWCFKTPAGRLFYPESTLIFYHLKADDIAIFYRMECFADNKSRGPVTVIGAMFFCCFAMPTRPVHYEDGHFVLPLPKVREVGEKDWPRFKMTKGMFDKVVQIRELVVNLLIGASVHTPERDAIVKRVLQIARSVRKIQL